jgi:hypothetical protein
MYPHSEMLQNIYHSMPPFQTSLTILCEISILHIYHKNVQQRIFVTDMTTTISPNLLGLDGSKHRKNNGDPDNSPLTGSAAATAVTKRLIPSARHGGASFIHTILHQLINYTPILLSLLLILYNQQAHL